ncbi:uncharacterized protein LOC131932758 [Physella acuta]|uniref:uncharacterized protein LOC131932758 n=1 Tax=Physella acuta TaxID=109671 RepID=UPI0027DE2711|nr:uncharacterized protein LOC131932758 [Physella acuta]
MDSPTLKLSRNSSVLLDRPVTSGTLRAGSLIFDLRRNSSTMLPPPPSITESARAKRKYKKVYPNKVYTPWYRRYVNHLPDGQRIDFQPGKEIRKIDEDIALQFFYGEDTPLLEERLTKECAERRLAALRRYTKIMEMRERASREKPENKKIEKNISLRSIIAANKSKQPDLKEEFGFNATEKKIISPILTFIQKLQVIKGRQLRGESRLPASSKWHLFQTPIMKTKLKNLILSTKHAAIRARFRRVINLVRCVYRFIHIISVISGDTKLIMKSVAQFTQEQLKNTSLKFGNQNRDGKGKMMFNAAKYKLSKRLPFSMEVKLTLTKPWFDRSDNEVTEVVKTLQVLRSFVEFPKSSQRRLAQVAWLIEVPADKVIIRECHISQDFYILLRGKAKMTKLNGSPFVDEKGEHTLIRWLKRDTIFGEESMSQPLSEREYTVYSTDHCDVLAVNINDYLDMLMKTRDDEEAPEHIAFIR